MSPQRFRAITNAIYHGRNVALFVLVIALIYNQTFWIFVSMIAAGLCTGALREAARMPEDEDAPPRSLFIQIVRISVPLMLTMFALGYAAVWLQKHFAS